MSLVVALLMAPAIVYLANRYYIILKQFSGKSSTLRIVLPLLLGSFYLFPISGLVDFYISGNIDVLKYPKPLTYWFWFGLVFVFQLATWVIIADLFKLIGRYIANAKVLINRIHTWLLIGLFVMVSCFTGWKVYNDTTDINTQEVTLEIKKLPKSLVGFKMVHISDIQGDEYTDRQKIARYIQTVNDQNPDLVVFTGDLISYGTEFIKQSAEEFGKVDASFGAVAVVGDHDYWAGVEHVRSALRDENIALLQDETQTVAINDNTNISITGVTEVYSKSSDPAVVDSLTQSTNTPLKIFASHQVADHIIRSARNHDYDLLLAGHTHGGQIYVPFMGMSFSASERETKYVSGLYREGRLPINVNNGLGFTLAPIRYNAPANVSVITLKAK
jgi:predicted MPP superfamily phosphohydrolase